MGKTSIEWTERTWNCVRGCSRVSAGCDNCYAIRIAHRFSGPGQPYEGLTRIGSSGVDWSGRVVLVPEKLDEPLRWRKQRRIFVNSMSDLFHESLPDEAISRIFAVMADAQWHTFQILTKRPARMREFLTTVGTAAEMACWMKGNHVTRVAGTGWNGPWPLPNVWLGVSVENQATADERIPRLLQTPAAKRFVSYEPALGPVDFSRWLDCAGPFWKAMGAKPLDQVIVGGESGPRARPLDLAWARSVRDQCRAAGVAYFFKQAGARPESDHDEGDAWEQLYNDRFGREPIGRWVMTGKRDRKSGDLSELPEDLRIREMPA